MAGTRLAMEVWGAYSSLISLPAVKTSRCSPEAKITPRTLCKQQPSPSEQASPPYPCGQVQQMKTLGNRRLSEYCSSTREYSCLRADSPESSKRAKATHWECMYLVGFKLFQCCQELLPHGQVHEVDWLPLQQDIGEAARPHINMHILWCHSWSCSGPGGTQALAEVDSSSEGRSKKEATGQQDVQFTLLAQ